MTARTFGRKNIAGGAVAAPSRRAAFGARDPDHFEPAEIDETALRRAAFIADERARAELEAAAEAKPFAPVVYANRSLPLAYMLWLILGSAGAHRFYLGRPLTGGLMALASVAAWVFVVSENYLAFGGVLAIALWVFADGFLIAAMHRRATTGA
ncbi:MAG TPA: TM2 domain-containing protein [Allosphingosinicella sp.]|nr:TM2 domain-containing protein [Allosphingosinicella sp.]